jgi:hypothetical protein
MFGGIKSEISKFVGQLKEEEEKGISNAPMVCSC